MSQLHTTLFLDQYRRFALAQEQSQRIDSVKEAETITQLTRVFGPDTRRIAIVNQDDAQGLAAYMKAGFTTVSMNGDRPTRLPVCVMDWVDDELPHTNRVIVISDDPAFGMLCKKAKSQGKETMVWLPSANIKVPSQFADHNVQYLPDLMPGLKVDKVSVFIDYENLHYGARDRGHQSCRD